jgi:hypothetical protein
MANTPKAMEMARKRESLIINEKDACRSQRNQVLFL